MTRDPICRRRVAGTERIGRACVECGHQDALHGGAPNPRLDGCLACVVDVLVTVILRSAPNSSRPRSAAPPPHLGASDAPDHPEEP